MYSPRADRLSEIANMCLYVSLVVTLFIIREVYGTAFGLDLAFLSCLSTPVTYTLMYYWNLARKFVSSRKRKMLDAWICDLVGLLASLAIGYVVYRAFGGREVAIYVTAFIAVQLMRICIIAFLRFFASLGLNIESVRIILVTSMLATCVGLTTTMLMLPLI